MFTVKRTKGPPPPAIGGAVVHYATEVAPAGNVTAWTRDETQAVLVPVAVAEAVQAFYRDKANAGRVECVPQKVAVVPVVETPPAPLPAPVEPTPVTPPALPMPLASEAPPAVEPDMKHEPVVPARSEPGKAANHKSRHSR